jgi:small subunit ribosomal protein S18
MAFTPTKKKRKVATSARPTYKNVVFDYKEPRFLQKFVMENGAIASRDVTGLTQKQQRQLATAVKRARHLALMSFTQTL